MRHHLLTLAIATLVATAGCQRDAVPASATDTQPAMTAPVTTSVTDEHSYAEPGKVRVKDLALDLKLDFERKVIDGNATLTLDWLDPQATQLVLDTRDLSIGKIVGERSDGKWEDLQYALDPADKVLGSRLVIQTPRRNPRVRINYTTSPDASGLQWLTAAMTEGKKTPFMFSQSQQIHARSWVPLQDTPSVRFTYTAHVLAPKDTMVVMSAAIEPGIEGSGDTSGDRRDGDYSFRMPQPIPSYLLAIGAGDLVFKPISERSGVWAEPAAVGKAVAEFADTEKMIQATEQLYGPYRWDRYDMLVLPPSFPYGGMENPRMTFLTPTVIVGDRSLVSLIAHELAHSWSGNLVTFSTAKDAWLNEGFTSYVENRIIEALYGKERADMENVIERNELKSEFTDKNKALQALAVKAGVLKDPDDNLSSTVYTKGAWFLEFLEQRFGRAEFDAFLRDYFDHFAFQSISTRQFADYAKANLLDKYPGKVTQAEFDAWLYEPGVPANAPQTASARFDAVDAARKAWLDGGALPAREVTAKWTTQEWVHFVEGMPETLDAGQLAALDAAYRFTGTPNGEIAQRWYPLAVRSGYTHANAEIAKFLERVGRRKLIMPTYKELVKTPEGLKHAEATFARAKPGYHPITTGSVETAISEAKAATPAAK